ncbi:protein kinase [Myxococcota bacterium]
MSEERHSTADAAIHPVAFQLPPELLEKAVGRLGAVSLGMIIWLVFIISLHLILIQTGFEDIAFAVVGGTRGITTGLIMMAASLVMFILTKLRNLAPPFVLDLGGIFAVTQAFGVTMLENFVAWPEVGAMRGVSWVVVWIVLYPVVVPLTPGKMFLTATCSALMGPVAAMVSIALGMPSPEFRTIAGLYAPNFVGVVMATAAARVIYRLGTDVSKARQMGSYRLVERIGSGGMGEVWRAEHRRLDRQAAVKFVGAQALRGENPSESAVALRRFEREANATAVLRCPHTVELFDFGIADDGTVYYVMELLSGLNVGQLVKKTGPLSADRTIHLLRQLCESLDEAHRTGLIHRDIKPSNIQVCRVGTIFDFTKVLDFGLVRSAHRPVEDESELTAEGFAGGTPAFMAPEMILSGKNIDHRVDIYAAGCVAYWMLTGRLVFDADSSVGFLMQHVHDAPTPPSRHTELDVPEDLDAAVLACLAKEPDDRPRDAVELSERLAACSVSPPWSSQRAEVWWRMHLPEASSPPLTNRETVLN